MKKTLFLVLFLSTFFSNAQYFEGFENGVPGSMTREISMGSDNWQNWNFGIGAAPLPLNGTKSATYYVGINNSAQAWMTTPILNLSTGRHLLTFKHIQRARAMRTNEFFVQFSDDAGSTWTLLESFLDEVYHAKTQNILLPLTTSTTCMIRFRALNKNGYAIILDDIAINPVQNNDAAITAVNTKSVINNGNHYVSGKIKNFGSNSITNIDISWQVDNGTIYTQSLSGLNIPPNSFYSYSHGNIWNASPGQHFLKVWVSNTNGGDQNARNDSYSTTVRVVNEVFQKTVVYEASTATWCPPCAASHVLLKDMAHYHQDGTYVGIAVHNSDPMLVTEYDAGIIGYHNGMPSGTINRASFGVNPNLLHLQTLYAAEVNKVPLAKIVIPDVNWNPATRSITFTTTTQFALDLINVNYRLAAVVVENGITGAPGETGYSQNNAYSGGALGDLIDWQGINWATLPSFISGSQMVYDHVGRALLGGFNGFYGSVPTTVNYNTPLYYNFSHTLPISQNVNKIEIVALVLDNVTGQVINVCGGMLT